MKKNILALAATTFLILVIIASLAFKGTGESPTYLTMNVLLSDKIIIHYENGTSETINLEGDGKKALANHLQKTHDTMNMLTHKGYRVVQTYASGNLVSYIFEKK